MHGGLNHDMILNIADERLPAFKVHLVGCHTERVGICAGNSISSDRFRGGQHSHWETNQGVSRRASSRTNKGTIPEPVEELVGRSARSGK